MKLKTSGSASSLGIRWAAIETTQKKRISYQILIFCQQIHSELQSNNSRQIEELHGCFEVICIAHRFSSKVNLSV